MTSSSTAQFSTAAQDSELESALDELLSGAMEEAEHPTYEKGARGHVEGSREFPRELVDTVSLLRLGLIVFD